MRARLRRSGLPRAEARGSVVGVVPHFRGSVLSAACGAFAGFLVRGVAGANLTLVGPGRAREEGG